MTDIVKAGWRLQRTAHAAALLPCLGLPDEPKRLKRIRVHVMTRLERSDAACTKLLLLVLVLLLRERRGRREGGGRETARGELIYR